MIPFMLPLGMALDIYLPSMPYIGQDLGASTHQVELTMSVFLFFFAVGQLVIGTLADNFGRKKILLASLLSFTLGSIICCFSLSIIPFLFGRILQALGACGSQVITLAMVRDQYQEKEATLLFTILKGSMSIAPIAAPLVGAYLQTLYGWQANFAVLALYGSLLLYLCLTRLKETLLTKKSAPSLFATYKGFLKPNFLYFCWCAMMTQAAMFGYFLLSPYYYINQFGLSLSHFAILFSVNSCAFLLAGLMSGKLIYKLGFQHTTLIAALMFLLSGLMMYFGHYHYNHYAVLLLPNLLASGSAAIMLGASTSGALMPYQDNAGKASALYGCIEFMGGGLIGSLTLSGKEISILPLASCLILLSLSIFIFYFSFISRAGLPNYSQRPSAD